MADSKMAVSQWSPDFVQDLLPAAEKTALLYNLSYLCLANFPNLERILRSRAVETQLLFGSSDAAMLKCILTSQNLVESLFPMLVTAVEKNKPLLAGKYLAKARVWIKDIITDVDRIVEKYDLHNKDVASSTSDVIKEKHDADKKSTEKDHELKQTEKAVDDLNSELQKTTEELEETEKKINSKSQEIQEFARSISQTSKGLGIFAAIVPFIGLLVKSIYDAVNDPKNLAQIKALEADLNRFIADKTVLKQKEWQIQLQLIDWQMKAAKASFDRNSIPDPIHLNEVQKSLTKIQTILIELKNFWENVAQILDHLEQKTFVGEDLIDLCELKDEFLESIKTAEEGWSCFGAGCIKASVLFKIQTKDAYKFLEVSPSSLSEVEWKNEYQSVKERLENINPPPQCVTSSGKIKDLLAEGDVDTLTRLVLVNAVYFKGNWERKFREDQTRDQQFKMSKDESKPVRMMFQKAKFPLAFIPENGCQVLELPYVGQELSMLIMLPSASEDGRSALQELERTLTYENFVEWTRPDMMDLLEVEVSLPRFRMEETYNMNDLLISLGMVDAFDLQKADFSGMSPSDDLVLSKVVHKAFVEVNEDGTEAAAATGAVMMIRCLMRPERFCADHPFLFFIRHNPSRCVLFCGRVCSP